jgi:hypothetical protein
LFQAAVVEVDCAGHLCGGVESFRIVGLFVRSGVMLAVRVV